VECDSAGEEPTEKLKALYSIHSISPVKNTFSNHRSPPRGLRWFYFWDKAMRSVKPKSFKSNVYRGVFVPNSRQMDNGSLIMIVRLFRQA
jgi:hypothetical protein